MNYNKLNLYVNEYNLLKRIDNQNYYLAKATNYIGQDLVDYEKDIFSRYQWN